MRSGSRVAMGCQWHPPSRCDTLAPMLEQTVERSATPDIALANGDAAVLATLTDVHKVYGDVEALSGITAQIPCGVVGLLGPNAAGKTTLLRLLLGLEQADQGSVDVLGWPLPESSLQASGEIGYMPEDDCLFPGEQGLEQVVLAGWLSGLTKVDALQRAHRALDLVGVGEARHRDASGYSLGMRQRLRLAMAIVHGPRLVLLDEPTAGLDPAGRDELLQVISEIGQTSTSVLLSTHVLSDVEAVCDQVLMLSNGKIGYCGPMSGFRTGAQGERWRLDVLGDIAVMQQALADVGLQCWRQGNVLTVSMQRHQHAQMWEAARDNGVGVRALWPAQESIGEAFLRHLHLDDPARPKKSTLRGGG